MSFKENNKISKAQNEISTRINKIIDSVRANITVEISQKDLKIDQNLIKQAQTTKILADQKKGKKSLDYGSIKLSL